MKLSLIVFAVVGVLVAVEALPPVITIGYQGAARTPITIIRLGLKVASWLSPCEEGQAPTSRSFQNAEECVERCPGHCSSLANCNATCVLDTRCVCGASQYCLINREVVNEDGSYGQDCFALN